MKNSSVEVIGGVAVLLVIIFLLTKFVQWAWQF